MIMIVIRNTVHTWSVSYLQVTYLFTHVKDKKNGRGSILLSFIQYPTYRHEGEMEFKDTTLGIEVHVDISLLFSFNKVFPPRD